MTWLSFPFSCFLGSSRFSFAFCFHCSLLHCCYTYNYAYHTVHNASRIFCCITHHPHTQTSSLSTIINHMHPYETQSYSERMNKYTGTCKYTKLAESCHESRHCCQGLSPPAVCTAPAPAVHVVTFGGAGAPPRPPRGLNKAGRRACPAARPCG